MATAHPAIYEASACGRVVDSGSRPTGRIALLASADGELRSRIAEILKGMRWEVREVSGGAEVFSKIEGAGLPARAAVGTVLLDSWLPDLEVGECVRELKLLHPALDLFALDGTDFGAPAPTGPFRNEVLHALRLAQQPEVEPAWSAAPRQADIVRRAEQALVLRGTSVTEERATSRREAPSLPELLGTDPSMLEVSRRIRLVAPRPSVVLIQGPTGTGKELVARALHRLSPRASRPFVALNCAAIPEALLEAELFGHTRGAFTGAVQGRAGRLEAAHGGTLFLDEIGELPLTMQAKLLRFIECGELQRVGENQPTRVDVRIVAATHRKLGQMVTGGMFRSDLFYRLSVFLIRTPALAGRGEDIRLLAEHVLAKLGRQQEAKTLTPQAMLRLLAHAWPGNVRELEHTLERAWILSEDRARIGVEDIDFGELTED